MPCGIQGVAATYNIVASSAGILGIQLSPVTKDQGVKTRTSNAALVAGNLIDQCETSTQSKVELLSIKSCSNKQQKAMVSSTINKLDKQLLDALVSFIKKWILSLTQPQK